jgi:hypothetical protein
MAKWQPPSSVGKNEQVGRRLFDQPVLAGAVDKTPVRLTLQHFEDSRAEVSLDRLGQTGVDQRVVRELAPIAVTAAGSFRPPKAFRGWQAIKAEVLQTSPKGIPTSLVASPISETEAAALRQAPNKYHAHVVCDVSGPRAYLTALHLRELFENKGRRVNHPEERQHSQSLSLSERLLLILATWGRKLRSREE